MRIGRKTFPERKTGAALLRAALILCLGGGSGLCFVKGGVGEIDVLGVHLLLAQPQAFNDPDRPQWKGTSR